MRSFCKTVNYVRWISGHVFQLGRGVTKLYRAHRTRIFEKNDRIFTPGGVHMLGDTNYTEICTHSTVDLW